MLLRHLAMCAACLSVVGWTTTQAADPPEAKAPDEKSAKLPTTKDEFAALAKKYPLPAWLPFRGQDRIKLDHIHGTVVAVSAKEIEVRPFGLKETVTYAPHVLLATGAVCHWEDDSNCYLLPDVHKGDEVMLGVGTVDKEKGDQCLFIKIHKRPGGVVPPSRKPSGDYPYHVNQQAKIDHWDKGVPLPDRLRLNKGPGRSGIVPPAKPKPPAGTPPRSSE